MKRNLNQTLWVILLLQAGVLSAKAEPVKQLNWKGFERTNLVIDGYEGYYVKPRHALAGNPWVWRSSFPDWHTEIDSILLNKEFYVAYINANDQFGSPAALQIWDKFYNHLHQVQLAPKVALEAVSRGGLYAYGWAKRNPDKVSCIYAETPVCDFKSWPGGKGTGEYNHLNSINLAKEVGEKIANKELSWSDDFKDIHPAAFGQELYFQNIKDMFQAHFEKFDPGMKTPVFALPKALDNWNFSLQSQSVSLTLEMAYDGWCVVQFAKKLGKTADYEHFIKRSQYYRNLYDEKMGFFRAKDSEGKWITPFNPLKYGTNGGNPFTEGNAWQYFWCVPQDIPDLIRLTAGDQKFTAKLDTFFTHDAKPEEVNGNASGFIGQYADGNEPSHHVAYQVSDNKVFTLKALNSSSEHIYIQSAKLNGKPYSNTYIRQQDIINGGTLELVMGPKPNKNWGTHLSNRPNTN